MPTENDPKFLSRQRFDELARRYVASKSHAKGYELDLLVEITEPRADWVALDIATGGGHTALKFAPHIARMIATDIAPGMLETARTFIADSGVKNICFSLADAENLPFGPETCDLAVCRIAPHHFPNCPGFVQEGARVLKPNGVLLVQDHVRPDDDDTACFVDAFEKKRDPSHNRSYTETQWKEMFAAAGLKVEHTRQIIKVHDFMPWAKRQGCTPETIEVLVGMMLGVTDAAAEWMQPHKFQTPEATFVNRHIIIAGRKRI